MVSSRAFEIRVLAFIFGLLLLGRAQGQIRVDCTGTDSSAFSSIGAAISTAGSGAAIVIEAGPCNESVFLDGMSNVALGTWGGNPVIINGRISITNSQGLYLYGLNVSSAAGDGISVSASRNIILDTCSSNGNSGAGLSVGGQSDVYIYSSGVFDNNGNYGMNVGDNSFLQLLAWGGLIDISNNVVGGLRVTQAAFYSLGNVTIGNNTALPSLAGGNGWGVDMRGGARAQFGGAFGPNLIENNQSGGAFLQETSEVSFWTFNGGYPNIIQANGPVGVQAGFGSQVTLWDGTLISGHTLTGVDAFASSQVYLQGQNKIFRNGTSTNVDGGGIRVDGNSEVLMRGGEISLNSGPGILALVNSSVDFTGVTFSGNTGGIIACDSTATMTSDLSTSVSTPPGVRCKAANAIGNRMVSNTPPGKPDISRYKAIQAKYRRIFTKH